MKGRIKRTQEVSRVILPIIGKIKVGIKEKSRNGTEYPKSVDYFVACGKYAALFNAAYGEKPQTIQIVFPDDNAENVCSERYEYRDDKGALIASGDGETFNVWNGKEYVTLLASDYPNLMQSIQQRYPRRHGRQDGDNWDIVLTITFIIPFVRGVGGVWQFTTKGAASTIPNIRNTFDAMLEQRGKVRGVIFDLSVQFAKSQKPGINSRYPVVTIVPNESEANLKKIKEAFQPIRIENK